MNGSETFRSLFCQQQEMLAKLNFANIRRRYSSTGELDLENGDDNKQETNKNCDSEESIHHRYDEKPSIKRKITMREDEEPSHDYEGACQQMTSCDVHNNDTLIVEKNSPISEVSDLTGKLNWSGKSRVHFDHEYYNKIKPSPYLRDVDNADSVDDLLIKRRIWKYKKIMMKKKKQKLLNDSKYLHYDREHSVKRCRRTTGSCSPPIFNEGFDGANNSTTRNTSEKVSMATEYEPILASSIDVESSCFSDNDKLSSIQPGSLNFDSLSVAMDKSDESQATLLAWLTQGQNSPVPHCA